MQIREFGLKHRSRELAALAGVPMTPGTGLLSSLGEALAQAERIGYPVMLKSTAGGGGIGLSRCDNEAELTAAYDSVQRMGEHFFRDGGAFIERYVDNARHVEVQIFGDGQGRVLALGERDCGAAAQPEGDRGDAGPEPAATPAPPCSKRRCGWASRSATARPARWSSSTTRPATASISWRSTRGCRSSIRSPRR